VTLRIVNLPSDPWARGFHHGQTMRDAIALCLREQADNILGRAATARRGVTSFEDLLALSARYAAPARAYAPDLWTEL
jgi:hypothetical protein